MPSLSSMRSVDPAGDSMQPLGPPVREVREVAQPLHKPTGTPGVVQMPDGKLATNLPLPPAKPAVLVHDSVCFDFDKDWKRSLVASPEMFQREFLTDLSDIEQRVSAWKSMTQVEAYAGGTTTGRFRGGEANLSNELKAELRGKRADVITFDDIEELSCDTCGGTGQVYQEHQRGCHVGGTYNCPDCNGAGELP